MLHLRINGGTPLNTSPVAAMGACEGAGQRDLLYREIFAVAKTSQRVTSFPQLRSEWNIGVVVRRALEMKLLAGSLAQQEAHEMGKPWKQRDSATNGECHDRGDQVFVQPRVRSEDHRGDGRRHRRNEDHNRPFHPREL